MTPEEINKQVADKVMGWEIAEGFPSLHHRSGRKRFAVKTPSFTTDIAAAWQVVEKIQRNGWLFEVGYTPLGGWYADISAYDAKGNQTMKAIVASKESAPMAICLAALKAV